MLRPEEQGGARVSEKIGHGRKESVHEAMPYLNWSDLTINHCLPHGPFMGKQLRGSIGSWQ